MAQWLEILQDYDFEVQHRQVDGGEGACDPLEPQELQWQQEADPALKKLLKWLVAGAAGGNGT